MDDVMQAEIRLVIRKLWRMRQLENQRAKNGGDPFAIYHLGAVMACDYMLMVIHDVLLEDEE